MQEFISTVDLARIAGVNIGTVRSWIRTGKIQAVQPFPRSGWRIPKGEAERFLGTDKSKEVKP